MRKLFNKLKYVWILAIVIFVSLYFYKNFNLIFEAIEKLPFLNVVTAILAISIAKVLLSYVSLLSTEYFSGTFTFPQMFKIYNITQLAKYIPGSIWQFVGKAGYYANHGLSVSNINKSLLVEVLWVFFTAVFFGAIFLFLSGIYVDLSFLLGRTKKYFYLYGFVVLLIIIICAYYYKKVHSFAHIVLHNYFLDLKILVTMLMVWIFLGLSFFVTLIPFTEEISLMTFVYIIGLYALAYAVGFAVPFAPAGIGIRESILVFGVAELLVGDYGVLLASLNRVFYIVVELVIVIGITTKTMKENIKNQKEV